MHSADTQRLRALVATALQFPIPAAHDRICALACRVLNCDIATICPAQPGIAAETLFPIIVPDTAADPAFAGLPPLANGAIGFAACMPLLADDGRHLGDMVLLHSKPHVDFGPDQHALVAGLAGLVTDALSPAPGLPAAPPRMPPEPSASSLRDRMQHNVATAAPGSQITAMLLELDGLDAMVDALGPHGDDLLQQLTTRMQAVTAYGDLLGRFGPDSFAVIRTGPPDERAIITLARRLTRFAAAPYEIQTRRIALAAHVGVATARAGSADADTLLRNAGIALARARHSGDAYRVFESTMGRRAERRRALRLDLGAALERDELHLAYQPLVDLRSGRVASFEALLRWQHPQRGAISPAEFIPVAEQAGLIDDIGVWVLNQACRDAAGWADTIGLSVNLSPLQFRAGWLPTAVKRALDAAALPPDRLELEITESVLLPDTSATLSVLNQLRALGVRIAMDDFGSGHASLDYLRAFAFDKIKIDQSFVRDMPTRIESAAIVRAITGLARDLGVATAAEGVENRAQLEQLRAESCDQAQGFLFSRPVPNANVPHVLAELGIS